MAQLFCYDLSRFNNKQTWIRYLPGDSRAGVNHARRLKLFQPQELCLFLWTSRREACGRLPGPDPQWVIRAKE